MKYIEIIQRGFPLVMCHSVGIDDTYESIVWDSGSLLPSKTSLDEWLAANPVSSTVDRKITVLAFRNRFTMQEKVTMELASCNNPTASIEDRTLAATLRAFLSDLNMATFIDLTRSDTRGDVQMLEQYGIILSGRALVILDSAVTDFERPTNGV